MTDDEKAMEEAKRVMARMLKTLPDPRNRDRGKKATAKQKTVDGEKPAQSAIE